MNSYFGTTVARRRLPHFRHSSASGPAANQPSTSRSEEQEISTTTGWVLLKQPDNQKPACWRGASVSVFGVCAVRGRFVYLTVVVMLVAVAAWPQHIVTQSAQKELFAVFHADSANDHREPGVVVILEKADWDKLLASVGNPSAGAVDFSTDAVLAAKGRIFG